MTLSPIERLGISTKPQAIGITGELIDKQLDAHCVAKGLTSSESSNSVVFANEKFNAHPAGL
jgi:hypothetical protein